MTYRLNGHDYAIAPGRYRPSALLALAGYRAEHFTLLVEYRTSALEHLQDDRPLELGPEDGVAALYPVYRG